MDLWDHVIRTLSIYVIVFLVIRLMGKREVGKLSVFDLVISVMVAEIAVIVIEDTDRPFVSGVIPMVVLLIVQVGLALIALRSRTLRHLFDGKPTVLIDRGAISREAMRKQRYNLDDLMQQLRENKVASVSEVEFAILETTGKLSVIEKKDGNCRQDDSEPGNDGQSGQISSVGSSGQLKFPKNYRFETLPVPLIMDGKLMNDNLVSLGKDRFWLNNHLKENGVSDLKQVFLCTVDQRGKLYINKQQVPRM
ncbi:DUF421 domain-containing protein [Paenibacillus spongiae]|uniref:DUF421 domain-containing protein n=1 Tax=Paenibacillus spongiae TaxID=2909671 RepID=A0ABY5S5H5_9BACL|nr:DUF421 domain-containing protein [Paenibacillus spongiae]UVI28090.1 DUF421 domain-containing protein [Paenibacillus spongiae]